MKYKFAIGAGAAALLVAVTMAANTSKERAHQREGPQPSSSGTQPKVEAVQQPHAASQLSRQPSTQPSRQSSTQLSAQHDLPELPPPPEKREDAELWQPARDDADVVVDGHPAQRLQADPKLLKQLHVGQRLRLHIPQQNRNVTARLNSTYNQTASTHVWQGTLLGEQSDGRVLITRGTKDTHVVLATQSGTYSAVIDNATGDTVLIDEGDINVNQIPFEDGIHIPPELEHPPTGSRD